MTPEMNSKIAMWRQKSNEGTLTVEELKEAVEALRGDRRSASVASEASRRGKAKVVVPSAEDLLAELGV
jgi:hypothetical protein